MYDTLQKIRTEKTEQADKEGGFTLIELLVVVVIIGILVAIAIPLYLNYREGAVKKSVQSDVRNSVPVVEQAYADTNAYPASDTAFNALSGLHKSDGNSLTYGVSGNDYTIEGAHDGSDKYCYRSTTGKTESGSCATP